MKFVPEQRKRLSQNIKKMGMTLRKTFIEVNKEKLKKKLKSMKISLFLIQFHSSFYCFLLLVNFQKAVFIVS